MTRAKKSFDKASYDKEYIKTHIERIPFDAPKTSHLKDRIKAGAKSRDMSMNGYITMAVTKQLDDDNIPEYIPDQTE